jgi:hypothetical protein
MKMPVFCDVCSVDCYILIAAANEHRSLPFHYKVAHTPQMKAVRSVDTTETFYESPLRNIRNIQIFIHMDIRNSSQPTLRVFLIEVKFYAAYNFLFLVLVDLVTEIQLELYR